MKMVCLAAMTAALSLFAKGTCTDAPVTFAIQYYAPSSPGMSSDSVGPTYTYGGNGIKTAILNCDGESAELSVDGVNRNVYLNLGAPGSLIDGTDPLPNPAPIAFFNIPFGSCFDNAQPSSNPSCSSFQTYLKVNLVASGYYFDMQAPGLTIPLQQPGSGVNEPCTTSIVDVTHSPEVLNPDGSLNTPEMWVVTPDSASETCLGASVTDVGTLAIPATTKHGSGSGAQFHVPFSMIITRIGK